METVVHPKYGEGVVIDFHPACGGQYQVRWSASGDEFWVYANEVDTVLKEQEA